MTAKEQAERLEKLARIERIVRQHFDRGIPAAERKRFMATGTFCPNLPADLRDRKHGVRTHSR